MYSYVKINKQKRKEQNVKFLSYNFSENSYKRHKYDGSGLIFDVLEITACAAKD